MLPVWLGELGLIGLAVAGGFTVIAVIGSVGYALVVLRHTGRSTVRKNRLEAAPADRRPTPPREFIC